MSSGKLEVKNVSVIFPGDKPNQTVQALEKINLTIEKNEFIVALGASGCGKTTLLNLMAGFIAPSSGDLMLTPHNQSVAHKVSGPGSDRGVVFQKHALLPWLSVIENVSFPLKLRNIPKQERYEVAAKNLALVKLEDFHNHKIYQLSGGMQQRVGIARALTSDPEMLLMDEPLGALDALTREKTQEIILDIWSETKKMVFFITHSVEEALFMATKVILMSPRPGRITETFNLDFSRKFLKERNARKIKSEPEFIAMREKLLNLIYEQELS